MNTSGRVDDYKGFSNPSALVPSGRENRYIESSLRDEVYLHLKRENLVIPQSLNVQ